MNISIIAAMAANRVIGNNNSIPWSLPKDLRQFKEKTLGHTLIVGRKTYESLGQPLPGRRNIVVSRNTDLHIPGCITASSLHQALELCRDQKQVFIIGGGQIFNLGLAVADTIILTILKRTVAGDTTFPDFSGRGFAVMAREQFEGREPFSVITYKREPVLNM
jgi:dihydrofolate reductase